MAVFPTTPILDDFNRPDEGGPPSSSWIDQFGWVVNGNQFVPQAADNDLSFFDTAYGPDCEAYCTIPVLPTSDDEFNLYVRLDPVNMTGYFVQLAFAVAGPDSLELIRDDGIAGDAGIGPAVPIALAACDSIGIRAIGNTITTWYKPFAGAWALQDTQVDATYPGANFTGIMALGTDLWTIDDYGAGTIVGGAFPQAGIVDTFTRADESFAPSTGWKETNSTKVISNQVGVFGIQPLLIGADGTSLWNNASIGPDCEVYATIGANPMDAGGILLQARLDRFGDAYQLAWSYNAAGVDVVILATASGGPLVNQPQDLAPGDKFGMQLFGDTINVYIDTGAGWTLLFSHVDPAPIMAAGYIGISFTDLSVGRLDNFGGGEYSSPLGGGMGTSTASSGVSRSLDTVAYVQFGDGMPVHRLGACTVIPTLPNPGPDARPAYKSVGAGDYRQIGTTPGASGVPGLTITTLLTGAANYLEEIKERGCAFNLYITTTACVPGTFDSWERAWVYRNCRITDDPVENVRHRQDDNLITHDFSITAWNGRIDHRPVEISRIVTSETADILSLGICSPACPSDCEQDAPPCQVVYMGGATVGGAIPDYFRTVDGGLTIDSVASGFPAASSIVAISCMRPLPPYEPGPFMVRDGITGLAMGAERDVTGAPVDIPIGATPNEAPVKDSGLFFLDYRHGWVCTDEGRVYFSGDGGLIWTEQATALDASGGAALFAIHFADAMTGYAVGESDTIIATKNGGRTWVAMTGTGSGDTLVDVHTFNRQRLIVATLNDVSDDALYMSHDATEIWETITNGLSIVTTDAVFSLFFLPDNLTGYLIKNSAASVGFVYKSINGGHDWRPIETPDNSILQSIEACQPNQGYVVGAAHDGTSFIAKMSG